jgi:hypothetical protein
MIYFSQPEGWKNHLEPAPEGAFPPVTLARAPLSQATLAEMLAHLRSGPPHKGVPYAFLSIPDLPKIVSLGLRNPRAARPRLLRASNFRARRERESITLPALLSTASASFSSPSFF